VTLLPVLEIGGTHVTAAIVDVRAQEVLHQERTPIDADAPTELVLDSLATAALSLPWQRPARWGIAIPGPFDYSAGVGLFDGVAKFGSLNGVDVNRELARRLPGLASDFVFVNDADAFAIGEWWRLPRRPPRAVFLTLGTGIGSCFLSAGVPVHGPQDGAPPHGDVYLLQWADRPLEDTVSRRALIAAYRETSGLEIDVADIAQRAREGDDEARKVFDAAFDALGRCLAPALTAFRADVVLIGGSIANSWDLVRAPLARGFDAAGRQDLRHVAVVRVTGNDGPLLGAARAALTMPPAPHPW
jgi:glucokinase